MAIRGHVQTRAAGFYGAICSSCRPRVSIMRDAAKAPRALMAAKKRNTEPIPPAATMNPTIAGPTAEPRRSQDVASPVPIARMRVG